MAKVDPADHRRGLELASRRLFLRGTLSIGALSLLTGCNLEDDDAVDRVLSAMSRWNDRVQAALFSAARLAPIYSEADITDPFPFKRVLSTGSGAPCRWQHVAAGGGGPGQ